jgi:DNA-binding XRE family transcriptional regulator
MDFMVTNRHAARLLGGKGFVVVLRRTDQLGAGRLLMGTLDPQDAGGVEMVSARRLFGSEVRRLRRDRQMSQEQLAALVMHSRTLIGAVEVGERWPPRDLAARCDEVLGGDGLLKRLWPLVDAERQAARVVLDGTRLSDLREAVLRLAVLTGTDLSVLSVGEPDSPMPDERRGDDRP